MEFYKNNTKLKAAGVHQQLEAWQIEELMNCMDNPEYFIEKYVKIIHVDRGIIDFKMYEYQKRYVKAIHNNRFTIAKWSRQSGKSTTTIAYFLYLILFNVDKKIGVLANKGATARELLNRLKIAYENLPLWMQVGVVTWNKGSILLGNGCSVIAASTSSSSIRGESLFAILLDEFAFLHPNMATDFFESTYPVISSGETTRIYIVSTPNGMNHFYRMWHEAIEKRSEFFPVEIDWWEVPGRDEKWKAETIRNIGEDGFEQEYGGSFLGSSNTLFASSILKALAPKAPVTKWNDVDIFEHPIKDASNPDDPTLGHQYIMTVDCSEGVGGDYTILNVTDVTEYPFKQVAVYRNNLVSPLAVPDIITSLARLYNNAWVLIETQSVGRQVGDQLILDLEYENVFTTTKATKRNEQLSVVYGKEHVPGLRMTPASKSSGCSNIKTLIENNKYIINDFNTIQEMSTFVRKGRSYEAEPGNHDDIMMTLVIFGWLQQQRLFKDLINKDIRAELFKAMSESLSENAPLSIFSGMSNDTEEKIIDNNGIVWTVVQ